MPDRLQAVERTGQRRVLQYYPPTLRDFVALCEWRMNLDFCSSIRSRTSFAGMTGSISVSVFFSVIFVISVPSVARIIGSGSGLPGEGFAGEALVGFDVFLAGFFDDVRR
jgi:hypothetical protein